MRSTANNKFLLLTACLVIGLVTLLSHSFRVEIKSSKKATTEQNSSDQKSIIITSSDAITVNFLTLHLEGFLELSPVFKPIKKVFKVVPVFQLVSTSYNHTLFRFIISPNAP